MRFRGPLLLVNILIVLGLILADVAIGLPHAGVSSQARAAASPPASEGMSSPALAAKRAKVKRQRRQDDRQDAKPKEDRKKDRKQADRKPDHKQADRKPDRQKTAGKAGSPEPGPPAQCAAGGRAAC